MGETTMNKLREGKAVIEREERESRMGLDYWTFGGIKYAHITSLLALADAVTRLGEARDLMWGLHLAGEIEVAGLARRHFVECTDAVLAARAALDGEVAHG